MANTNSIIQAQVKINGKKTFFVTRPKDIKFEDGTTLEDKKFGSGESTGIEEEEVNKIVSSYMGGIKFEEELMSEADEDNVPDDYLDPELIAYIDTLFSSLNDLVVDIPKAEWVYDGKYYTLTVPVEEVTGVEYPVVSVISESNTTDVMDTDTISDSLRDVSIENKHIILKSNTELDTGFKLILKGINVQGGKIVTNYNKLAEYIEDLNKKMDINDLIVDVTVDDWVNENGVYTKIIPVDGINSTQNIIYTLFNSPATESQKISYENITSLITIDNAIVITSTEVPLESYKLILKSALVTNGTESNDYKSLNERVKNLEESNLITLSDEYKTYDPETDEKKAASVKALNNAYNLLDKKFNQIEDVENIVFDNHKGKLHVITKGGWCRISGYIIPTVTSFSPLAILKDLPKPFGNEINTNLYIKNSSIMELSITTDGVLYVTSGDVNSKYLVEISYPYIEEE